MKKIYESPTMECIHLSLRENILANSIENNIPVVVVNPGDEDPSEYDLFGDGLP